MSAQGAKWTEALVAIEREVLQADRGTQTSGCESVGVCRWLLGILADTPACNASAAEAIKGTLQPRSC